MVVVSTTRSPVQSQDANMRFFFRPSNMNGMPPSLHVMPSDMIGDDGTCLLSNLTVCNDVKYGEEITHAEAERKAANGSVPLFWWENEHGKALCTKDIIVIYFQSSPSVLSVNIPNAINLIMDNRIRFYSDESEGYRYSTLVDKDSKRHKTIALPSHIMCGSSINILPSQCDIYLANISSTMQIDMSL